TRNDLKQVLAWTTVSSLGAMFILVGLHELYAWKTLFVYIIAHAGYKASLFLCVGNIDKKMGTRDLRQLFDLRRVMPITSFSLLLASGSMIGLPFSLGFIAKEYLFKSALLLPGPAYILVGVLICSSALSLAVTVRLMHPLFVRQENSPERIRIPWHLWAPPLVLASVGWLSVMFLEPLNDYVIMPLVSSLVLGENDLRVKLWSGFNTPFFLSLMSMSLGLLLWVIAIKYLSHFQFKFTGAVLFENFWNQLARFSDKLTRFLQNGRLSFYSLWIFIALGAVTFFEYSMQESLNIPWSSTLQNTGLVSLSFLLILSGTASLVLMRQPLALVLASTTVGFGVGLLYISQKAMDLALTQIAVESISVFVFILALFHLNTRERPLSPLYQSFRAASSLISFITLYLINLALSQKDTLSPVGKFYLDHSEPLGRGLNAVNVILVDFRAIDTFGEITVLALVGLGAFFMLRLQRAPFHTLKSSPLLDKASRVLIPLLLTLSLYILWRGHNKPGGGFVGGLILAITTALHFFVYGRTLTLRRLKLSPSAWAALGLVVALISGSIGPLVSQEPFFSAQWLEVTTTALGTPLLFDVGIYFLVFGICLHLLFYLRRTEP
ncbi:MAG: hydrogen gas-evolving membrane-bound hydrogenase subunit E, partial [Bdellovibrio sp.]